MELLQVIQVVIYRWRVINMNSKNFELLITEIRENRKEIQSIKLDVNTMKVKFTTLTAVVSMVFGVVGAYIKGKLGQ